MARSPNKNDISHYKVIDVSNIAKGKLFILIGLYFFYLIPIVIFFTLKSLNVPIVIIVSFIFIWIYFSYAMYKNKFWIVGPYRLFMLFLVIDIFKTPFSFLNKLLLIMLLIPTFIGTMGLSLLNKEVKKSSINLSKTNSRSFGAFKKHKIYIKVLLSKLLNKGDVQIRQGINHFFIGIICFVFPIMAHTLNLFFNYIDLFITFCLGLLLYPVGFLAFRHGWRVIKPDARELLFHDNRPPVVLIRSFADDELKIRRPIRKWLAFFPQLWFSKLEMDFEEVLANQFYRIGPVVAIGRPNEKYPPLGAARSYLQGDEWRSKIETLSGEAKCIITILGDTPGIKWELCCLEQLKQIRKTVFLIPPVSEEEVDRRWRELLDMRNSIKYFSFLFDINIDINNALVIINPQDAVPIVLKGNKEYIDYKEALNIATKIV